MGEAETAALREYLRANMFDGDEGGTVTHTITALLDDIVELVADFRATEAVREPALREPETAIADDLARLSTGLPIGSFAMSGPWVVGTGMSPRWSVDGVSDGLGLGGTIANVSVYGGGEQTAHLIRTLLTNLPTIIAALRLPALREHEGRDAEVAGLDVWDVAMALHETAPVNHNLGEGPLRGICNSIMAHEDRAMALVARLAPRLAPRSTDKPEGVARLRDCGQCGLLATTCKSLWPAGRKCCPDCTHAAPAS